jgi:molybdopterin converting factor subunit 1
LKVTIRLFAGVRERIGAETVTLSVPTGSNVAGLRAELVARHPVAEGLIARSAVAVNGEYATADRLVHTADEIALIPPVSGG